MPRKNMGDNKKSFGLGLGLSALLPEIDSTVSVQDILIGDLDPNPDQPRQIFSEESIAQLSQSIREQGVLQPLIVVPTPGNRYRIVAGERRWRAAREAGREKVPCVVRDLSLTDQMEIALIENLQREDLNPMETAEGIRNLMDSTGMTQETAAERLSMSRPALANALRLLNLPQEVRTLVRDGVLSAGHGRVLAGISDPALQTSLARDAVDKGYNVRQLEELASKMKRAGENPPPKPPQKELPVEMKQMQQRLQETVGMHVRMSGNIKKGKIVLQYSSREDLERLYELLEKMEEMAHE